MKLHKSLLIAAASVLGVSALSACESHDEGPPPPRAVVVEPGYYYEPEYYDADRGYHAPIYYYYDGHHYERRDYVPHGYVPRIRQRDGAEAGGRFDNRDGELRDGEHRGERR
ncbi:MAG TPA: hypothetical protein VLI90_12135 [Tepidisphaeraceae bacterium]|nr:hypothetical protein [Tepidisphaeraceae bacterium]